MNGLISNELNAGKKLKIPLKDEEKPMPEPMRIYKTYVVKKGDTFWGISQKLNVSIDYLMETNNKIGYSVKEGEVLKY